MTFFMLCRQSRQSVLPCLMLPSDAGSFLALCYTGSGRLNAMGDTTSPDTGEIPAESEAVLAELLAETRRLNAQMQDDQADVNR